MAAPSRNLRLLRSLIRELRLSNEKVPVQKTAQYAYIMDQFRGNQVTAEKVCRGYNQAEHLGDTYKCLLESVRKHQEMIEQYKGAGERSIQQSAHAVGLELPVTHQDPTP